MKQQLLNLIADGKLKEALDAMRRVEHTQSKYFTDPLIGLLSRYNRNERSKDDGTLDPRDYQIEYNRIESAVKSLLDSDFNESKIPPALKSQLSEAADPQAAGTEAGNITISKTITVPGDFKGGIFQNVIGPFDASAVPAMKVEKKTILFAAANPSDQTRIETDRENRIIKEQIKLGDKRDAFDFLDPQLAVRITELIRAFNQKPDIIHFSGHGETAGIMITDDQNQSVLLNEMAIKRLFKPLSRHTQLVLLNSCYSAEQAKTISSLGMYVIGYNAPVGDPAAIAFAKGFYVGLSEGKPFEEAFNDGMIVMATESPGFEGMAEVWYNGEQLNW